MKYGHARSHLECAASESGRTPGNFLSPREPEARLEWWAKTRRVAGQIHPKSAAPRPRHQRQLDRSVVLSSYLPHFSTKATTLQTPALS
eukprot:13811-Rhodomonas_salina.3